MMFASPSQAPPPSSYGALTALAVMINFCIGTGVFGLPVAFYRAGVLLALGMLGVAALFSLITLLYTLEAMARAEGIISWNQANKEHVIRNVKQSSASYLSSSSSSSSSSSKFTETDPLIARSSDSSSIHLSPRSSSPTSSSSSSTSSISILNGNINGYGSSSNRPDHQLRFRKLDFTIMSQLFGGWQLTVFTQICLMAYCYGVLWAYAAVFASSVDTLFFQYALGAECNIYTNPSEHCVMGYYICIALFAAFVIVVSLRDISEQASMQMVLTFNRFAAFGTMIITVLVAWTFPNHFDANASTEFPYVAHLPLMSVSGFGLAFSVSCVALNVHYNMPDVVQPMADKSNVIKVAIAGMSSATLFYIFIGWICAQEFGASTLPLVSLNWSHYTGLDGGWGAGIPAWWATAIKLFIMCFPVVNMLSVYPLICVSLGDNLIRVLPSSWPLRYSSSSLKSWCRMVACIPPLFLAAVAGKLDVIFSITGLFAFFLEFLIPCFFAYLSHRYCVRKWGAGSEKTEFTTILSNPSVIWIIISVSLVACFYAIYCTADQIAHPPQ